MTLWKWWNYKKNHREIASICHNLGAPTRTSNDKGKENKRVEEVILTLELGNKDLMNLMEVFIKP
jgi:hypothetical protein